MFREDARRDLKRPYTFAPITCNGAAVKRVLFYVENIFIVRRTAQLQPRRRFWLEQYFERIQAAV